MRPPSPPSSALLPCLAASLALSACMVGPDYKGPPNAAPIAMRATGYRRAAVARAVATPPLAAWWTALDDPTLDAIEVQALRNSPTLAAAVARVRNARATVGERETALLPSGGASALYLRTHVPSQALGGLGGQSAGAPASAAATSEAASSAATMSGSSSATKAADLYSVALDATWQIDVFGGTRRKIESAKATADYQQAELDDAQVTLTGDVARAYVNLRDRQNRLALTQRNVVLQQRMLDLTQQRRTGGTASDLDVDRLVTQLKQTQSQAPMLAAEVEIYTDQLAQLSGQEPGALDTRLGASRPIPLPPAVVAVGDPANLIRRRPDIRAAERQIAAENAMIGVNIAQYFPTVTLLGTIGYSGMQANKLFAGNALTYLGGPSISWNIFNAPQISTQVAEARASTEEARQNYRKAVLSALLDAENALSRFGHQRDDVVILADAEYAARHAAMLSGQRLAGGTSSVIDTLDIERQRIETQTNLAQGTAQLTSDWVALQASLGLGWDAPQVVASR